MKYIAVLDTDEIEDFAFFEDGKEKYLHGIDANSVNEEWIYLPFKPLKQEPILDKIRAEIEKWHKDGTNWSDIRLMNIEDILDKYKAEIEPQESEDNNGFN